MVVYSIESQNTSTSFPHPVKQFRCVEISLLNLRKANGKAVRDLRRDAVKEVASVPLAICHPLAHMRNCSVAASFLKARSIGPRASTVVQQQ